VPKYRLIRTHKRCWFIQTAGRWWGKVGRDPASGWFEWGCAGRPECDVRVARQYRYELPPEFPLASPYSGIVHHLSGLSKYALPPPHCKQLEWGYAAPQPQVLWFAYQPFAGAFTFITPLSFKHSMTRIFAKLLGPCFKTGRRDDRLLR